ncbi:MAG: hypothetical protein MJ102_07760 [Clostridia bacterium]|nr:hypothetical protein [Clostridia bacterium]
MIIFVRIADMKYYRGITEKDVPHNGGSFVSDTGEAHECFNFDPVIADGENYEKCIGYFQLSGGTGVEQLHIEKIRGCELLKNSDAAEGIDVVFVSKALGSQNMRVVGFYKNAVVYRFPHCMTFDSGYEQTYWCEAKKEDCVLLPYSTRFSDKNWYVPSSTSKYADYGFGRSNIWYAGAKGASDEEIAYTDRMKAAIHAYSGENRLDAEVEA